jgi:hypothetical protein
MSTNIILKKDRICGENMRYGIFSGEVKTRKGVCLVAERVYLLQRAEKCSYWLVDLTGEYVKDGAELVTITDMQAAGARQRYFDVNKPQIIAAKEQEIYIGLVGKIQREVIEFLKNVETQYQLACGKSLLPNKSGITTAIIEWAYKENEGTAANLRAQAFFVENPTLEKMALLVYELQQAGEWDGLWVAFYGSEIASFTFGDKLDLKAILESPAVGHIRLIAAFQVQKLLA